MIWNVFLSLAAFLAILVAVKGKTWDEKGRTLLRRITITGWASLLIGLLVLSFSLFKTYDEFQSREQLKIEAAKQVLAEIAPQAKVYGLLLLNPNIKVSDVKDYFNSFTEYLEAKLERYSRHLPKEALAAAEQALTDQKELEAMIAKQKEGNFSDDDQRAKVRECFESAKNLGDALLRVMGNKVGMDGTYIISDHTR